MSTRSRPPLIIGHRGSPDRFPDNSRAGVKAALEAGADGVEVDVRRCAEGVWVCAHDHSFAGRPIAAWAFSDLRRKGLPSLAEVVEVVPADRYFYVEVKPLAADSLWSGLDPLARLLEPRLPHTRMLSSSLAVLAAVATVLPRVSCSWVVGEMPEAIPEGVELSPRHTLVEALRGRGVPLHPWTVNRPRRMCELADLGVASITTNRPALAVEVPAGELEQGLAALVFGFGGNEQPGQDLRNHVAGRDEVNVVAAAALQVEHHPGQVLGLYFLTLAQLADLGVLAILAAQVTPRKKDRP